MRTLIAMLRQIPDELTRRLEKFLEERFPVMPPDVSPLDRLDGVRPAPQTWREEDDDVTQG